MQLQLIRNATLRLTYGGQLWLIDPYLAPRHSRPSYTGKSPNPLVELPCSIEDVLAGVEVVVVSHLHSDHFDPVAHDRVRKDLPLFCQPGDEPTIVSKGFEDVRPVVDRAEWNGVSLTRTPGQHGSGAVLADMGRTSGFVFRAEGEPTLYWAGDTILTDDVLGVIASVRPDVIVTHSSGAVWGPGTLIVMDAEQTVAVCEAAPTAVVVAVHLDSLDHGTVSRADLRAYGERQGIGPDRLRIPADGETLSDWAIGDGPS